MDLPMSDKQILSVRESRARINVWEGSVRSGKTIASLFRFMMYVATSHIRGELVVVSRTRASAARNVFAPLMDRELFGDWAPHVSYTAGADSGYIFGRKVWILGSSDVRSENVLRGLTCSGAYVDEITLLQEDFFTQLLNRLWDGAKLFGTTNPDNPAHWLKAKFLDRLHELPDWRSWKFLLDDNPQLSQRQKDAIRRENTGLYYRRNVLGEWVAAEGAIYDSWDPDRHIVPWESLPPMQRLLGVGLDYGTTNATAGLLLGLSHTFDTYGARTGTRLYLIDEYRYDPKLQKTRLTNEQLSAGFRSWLASEHLPYPTHLVPERTFVDPAAASFKVQLQVDGVTGVMDADNSVGYGISTVASLLASGHLFTTDRTPGWNGEAPGYSWDPKETLRGADKPIKVADHSLDAGRYVVTTTETIWRPLIGYTLAA